MNAFSTLQLTQSRGAEGSSSPAGGIDYPGISEESGTLVRITRRDTQVSGKQDLPDGKLLPDKSGLTIPLELSPR
jgi:hypothetical protein